MMDEHSLLPDDRFFDLDSHSSRHTFKPSLKGVMSVIGAVVGAGLFFANVETRQDYGYVNGISHESATLTISDAPSMYDRKALKMAPRQYHIPFEQIAEDGF